MKILEIAREIKPSTRREKFYQLINTTIFGDCKLWAFDEAVNYFKLQHNNTCPNYSLDLFDDWLEKKYDLCSTQMNQDHWLDSGKLMDGRKVGNFSDLAVLERIVQYAPTNLLDGIWLSNILPVGPCSQVEAILFKIRMDEGGNGIFEKNHPNLYQNLLNSVGKKIPSVYTKDFSKNKIFLDCSFEESIFQMCVGMFPKDFLPELLGMTLFMEWTATPASLQIARCLKKRNIESQYYWVHAQIDNVINGHGFLAKEAIKLHLKQIKEDSVEQVQIHWRRIWNGYHIWERINLEFEQNLQDKLLIIDKKKADN
jgi:hypothetical protein